MIEPLFPTQKGMLQLGHEIINFVEIRHKIHESAGKCVKCALCLPHCPTYQLRREEGESPRGRLSLMMAIAASRLDTDRISTTHLDNCLDCRACEAVCPAAVPFGEILANTRYLQRLETGTKRLSLLTRFATRIPVSSLFRFMVAMLTLLRIRHLLQHLPGTAGKLVRTLPSRVPSAPKPGASFPAVNERRGTVALFLGCAATSLDTQTLIDSITLLTMAGYDVEIPTDQQCCGALADHAGDMDMSARLSRLNTQVFGRTQYDAVIITATGCAAHLKDMTTRTDNAIVATEICQFLQNTNALSKLTFKKLSQTILLHTPCTARNVLLDRNSAHQLLQNIHGITLHQPSMHHCCGAAGSYFLDHADTADDLVNRLLAAADLENVAIICTSNYGCGMHLRAHLPTSKVIEIMHPVSLLARQLTVTGR